jgi:hypothetical protein
LGRPIGVIHYPTSEEYFSDSFSANRLIIDKGKEGLAQMLGLKKSTTLDIGPLIALSSKVDYDSLIQKVTTKDKTTLFD